MSGTISPFPKPTFLTDSGLPAVGYKLFTYVAGTASTKQTTWTDSALSAANTNPIILDSAGRATIFLGGLNYKFVLAPPTDTDPPATPTWTVDGISSVPAAISAVDVIGVAGEVLVATEAVYLSDGTGGLNAGQWYKTSATNEYSSAYPGALGFATGAAAASALVTVRIMGEMTGLAGLTAGALYYLSATAGVITVTAPTNARAIGKATSATTLLLSPWLPVKTHPLGVWSASAPAYKPYGWSAYTATTPGLIKDDQITVGNVGAGEDTLKTYTLPGGTLNENRTGLSIVACGRTANTINAKTLRFYFGGLLLQSSLTVSEAGCWVLRVDLVRTSAAAQWVAVTLQSGPNGSAATMTGQNAVAGAANTAADVEIKITGEAVANDDIDCLWWRIMLIS